MSLRVREAGLLTTVQDLGRPGYQGEGVPVGGAMDPFALRVANLLVGNDPGAAGLEITLAGPTLTCERDLLLAITGAPLGAALDGAEVPPWRPVVARAGATLRFGGGASGCRAYLAVAGGIDVPVVLGSRSTLLGAGMGGVEGRALRAGDHLACATPTAAGGTILEELLRGPGPWIARWGAGPSLRPAYSARPVVRLIGGEHEPALTDEARRALYGADFRLSPRSDRMGCRLEGPALALAEPVEPLSEAVTFGTVQLPPDGQPIVLMADRQTTGGYPRIGEVATVDLPLLAQLRPGDRVVFQPCSVAAAQSLLLARERDLARFALALALRAG